MLQLVRGDDSLIVAPEHGGAIVGWTRHGIHMFRRPSPEAMLHGRPGAMGCFPLVPFCNRIAWRHFNWAGRAYELAANFGDHPHAIHGVGWRVPWLVEAVSADSVTLSLRHEVPGESARAWPFAFTAHLTYGLTTRGLTVRIDATSLHTAPVPMGIGIHPYFPCETGTAIMFQATGVWINRDALPVTHGPIPPEWSHADGRMTDHEPLDNCFTGWNGAARIPGMRIDADPVFGNLQIFTPRGANFFCVEPVSHVPGAIDRADLAGPQAMPVLAPGQTIGGCMTLSPHNQTRF